MSHRRKRVSLVVQVEVDGSEDREESLHRVVALVRGAVADQTGVVGCGIEGTADFIPGGLCGAKLTHAHGTAVCGLPSGHDPAEQHAALCDLCQENDPEYGDPSDRLHWDRDGESWRP
ncbi:hypothetical protein [Streptomyces sp. NPDC008150]|uniref:hypothetical protein n=1 Tax=Streptomyces sp. NPDC008150 TaxID=3364816 RepID=UPI0036F0F5B3